MPSHPERRPWRAGTLTYTSGGLAALFCWLLWGDFAWAIKERSVTPVLQLLLKQFHASDTLAGILIGSLPPALTMLVGPIFSSFSDRHRGPRGRRIPFLLFPTPLAVTAMIGLAFTPPLALWLDHVLGARSPSAGPLTLGCFGFFWMVFELVSTTANSIFGGLINDVVPRPVLGRFYGAFRAVSLVAGIVFTFWLFGKAASHYVLLFLGMAAVYGIGFTAMCLNVREGEYELPPPLEAKRGAHPLAAAGEYFRECFSHSYYLWFYLAMALITVSGFPINLYSVFFSHSVGMSDPVYGKCLALTYTISLALAYPLGVLADRFHPLRVTVAAIALYAAVTLWGMLCAKTAWTFGIALVAHGVLGGTCLTATASLGQRLLPAPRFAQFTSALGMVISMMMILLGPVIGLILDHLHHAYRATFLMSCLLAVGGLAAALVLHRKFMAHGGPRHYVAPE